METLLASATIGTIRLRFFKLAARVKVSLRRVLIEYRMVFGLSQARLTTVAIAESAGCLVFRSQF